MARAFNAEDREKRAAEIERVKQEQLLEEARILDQINEVTERSVEESPIRQHDLQGAFPDSRETLNSAEPLVQDQDPNRIELMNREDEKRSSVGDGLGIEV